MCNPAVTGHSVDTAGRDSVITVLLDVFAFRRGQPLLHGGELPGKARHVGHAEEPVGQHLDHLKLVGEEPGTEPSLHLVDADVGEPHGHCLEGDHHVLLRTPTRFWYCHLGNTSPRLVLELAELRRPAQAERVADASRGYQDHAVIGLDGFDLVAMKRNGRLEFRVPFPDEVAKGFGQRVLDIGASGLSYVAGALDKPGQAVRNVLAGRPMSALKMLTPFSESLGIADKSDHISGRQLLDSYGMTDKNDNVWGAWGAGLATDIATDPLTYATFGAKHALNPVGRALEKAGHLKWWTCEHMINGFGATESGMAAAGNTASDITYAANKGEKIASPAMEALGAKANAPLSGLVRFSVPFLPDAGVTLGTGRMGQAVARGMGTVGGAIKYGNPVGRWTNQLFDSNVQGAVDRITQEGAAKYMTPALKALQEAGRTNAYNVLNQLDPLIRAGTYPEATVTGAARAVAEGVPHSFDPALTAQVGGMAGDIGAVNARHFAEARQAGAPIQDVGDKYANYVHRQALDVKHANLQMDRAGNLYPVVSGSNIHREELFRDIPGGSNRIDDWWKRYAGAQDKANVARAIKKDLVGDLVAGGGQITQKLGKTFDTKAEALAERLAVADPRHVTDQLPLFTPNLAGDVIQRGAQHARTVASARAAIGTLGDVAQQITPGSDLIPITTAMQKLGLKTYGMNRKAGTPMEGALVEMMNKLAPQGAGKVDPFLRGPIKNLRGEVAKYGITPEHYGQITKAYQRWVAPEQIKSPLKFFDSATNLFKALAYPIWIPAHVRNAVTAATNNMRSGTGLGDYMAQLGIMRGTADATQLGRYGFKTLDEARRAQFAGGNIFGAHGLSDDIAGSATEALLNTASRQGPGRFTPLVPGADRAGTSNLVGDVAHLVGKEGLLDSLTSTGKALAGSLGGLTDKTRHWGQSLGENLGIKGVGGALQDVNPAVHAAQREGFFTR